eukprot:NODE_329_length_10886_cov_0.296653.p5 type:complete len:298 gc:universal NODE_329_length_10886_cov_0.296653:8201-7308(-)
MEIKLAQQENVFFGAYPNVDPLTLMHAEIKPFVVSMEVVEKDNGWTISLSKGISKNMMGCYFNNEIEFTSAPSKLKIKNKAVEVVEALPELEVKVEDNGPSMRERIERRSQSKRTSKQSYSKPVAKKAKTKTADTSTRRKEPEAEKMIITEDIQKNTFVISSSDEEDENQRENKVLFSEDDMHVDEFKDEEMAANDEPCEKLPEHEHLIYTPRNLTDVFGATNNKPISDSIKKRKKIDKMETINGKVYVKEVWVTDDEPDLAQEPVKSTINRIINSTSSDSVKKKQTSLNAFFKVQK